MGPCMGGYDRGNASSPHSNSRSRSLASRLLALFRKAGSDQTYERFDDSDDELPSPRKGWKRMVKRARADNMRAAARRWPRLPRAYMQAAARGLGDLAT